MIQVIGGPDMTLDEISGIGELVTETLDEDANVIWGARVQDDMKGKLMVMTIITGVNSPWIVGKHRVSAQKTEQKEFADELGIELIK